MPKGKVSGIGKVLLWILAIFLVIVTGLQIFDYMEFRPTGKASEEVEFTIEEGESMSSVISELKEDGLIRSDTFTRYLLRLMPVNHYAGTFKLNKGMSTQQILQYISNPDNIDTLNLNVTIIPGEWAKDVAANIAELFPNYTQEDILNTWNDINYINQLANDYTFLNPETLANDQLKVKLEGYLYPNTYNLTKDMTIDQITRMFLDEFNKVYTEHKAEFDASQYSVEEVLTLASIVQFEAGSDADMPMIAGVFKNRLDQGMDLQSSVTVCYALYENYTDATACETNTDIDSPYNTYLHSGLPAGPINNPSWPAISAVLNPAESNNLFFVADVNHVKDGGVYYAETYDQHLALMEELGLAY